MKKNFLDSIDVKSPCNESWEEMTGNDEVRFCSHCAKNVHNISAMTRPKAEKLIKNANGNLCVRYVKNPVGKIVNLPPKLTQIKRRARIAAGVLATSLTLSTLAYSQGEPLLKVKTTQTQKDDSAKSSENQDFSSISGNVIDEFGAFIPNVKITLTNVQTKESRITNADSKGFYEFKDVAIGTYDMEIEAQHFEKLTLKNLESSNIVNIPQTITLKVASKYEIVGDLMIVESEIECPDTKPAENIQQEKLVELPLNPRKFVTMGLIPATQTETKPTEKDAKSKKKKKKT